MADSNQPGNADAVQSALQAVSDSLVPRGYLTTEWWTTIVGGALSAVLAVVHISASSATHVVAVVAPALLAALYAVARTMHKSALAALFRELFPQATAAIAAPVASGQLSQVEEPAQAATLATAQTDPDFVFEGIPPIEEESDG
jgi:hypothetical protein